jgi:hypothetical protein
MFENYALFDTLKPHIVKMENLLEYSACTKTITEEVDGPKIV